VELTSRAATFFSADDQESIRQAVASAEAHTSGEIATMVVDASDAYHDGTVRAAVLLAGMLALAVSLALQHSTVWFYIPVVFALYVPCHLLSRSVPVLCRPFVSRRRQARAVRERAVRAFYEQGLHRTRAGTGILIFVSLLERTVWILGDQGINARIEPGVWQELAGELSLGIRSGTPGRAMCRTIERCAALLAEHFPQQGGDRNELPDTLLLEPPGQEQR
jgi:putative membrane protein